MLQRISDRILYLPADGSTDRPILAAVSGSERTLLVDSGNSSSHARLFLEELGQEGLSPITYAAITHWHWDHTFGIHQMALPTIAHTETAEELKRMMGYEWSDEAIDGRVEEGIEISFCADMIKKEFGTQREIPICLPDILFDDKVRVDLGDLHCVVENVGGDHSRDSTVVFVEEEKTLFLGDCMGPDIYSAVWKYTTDHVLGLLRKLEGYGAEVYVASHWRPESKEEFQQFAQELRMTALLTQKFGKEQESVLENLAKEFNRPLNKDDLEMVDWFTNGL